MNKIKKEIRKPIRNLKKFYRVPPQGIIIPQIKDGKIIVNILEDRDDLIFFEQSSLLKYPVNEKIV